MSRSCVYCIFSFLGIGSIHFSLKFTTDSPELNLSQLFLSIPDSEMNLCNWSHAICSRSAIWRNMTWSIFFFFFLLIQQHLDFTRFHNIVPCIFLIGDALHFFFFPTGVSDVKKQAMDLSPNIFPLTNTLHLLIIQTCSFWWVWKKFL